MGHLTILQKTAITNLNVRNRLVLVGSDDDDGGGGGGSVSHTCFISI